MNYVLYSYSDEHGAVIMVDNQESDIADSILGIANFHTDWQNRGFCFWLGVDADV